MRIGVNQMMEIIGGQENRENAKKSDYDPQEQNWMAKPVL
jgi:hypothetical protein